MPVPARITARPRSVHEWLTIPFAPTPESAAKLAALTSRRLADPTRRRLIRRLVRAGFIPCDIEANVPDGDRAIIGQLRRIFERLTPDGVAIKTRTRSWRKRRTPPARRTANRMMFMRVVRKGEQTFMTACFDPLTGVVYLSYENRDLSKLPYCMRDVARLAREREVFKKR